MKTNYYLYLAINSYILPCILFGNLTLPNSIYLVISTIVLGLLIRYKSTQKKRALEYIYTMIEGASLSTFGITVFGHTSVQYNTLIYFTSAISFIILSSVYRNKKRQEYLKQFENNPISLQRDERINEILGINS